MYPHVRHDSERASPNAGEEGTKQALVVPLLQVLGYDVFDPREVRPEHIADFAVKKAGQFEKVDYGIYLSGTLAFFVECKALGKALNDDGGQLGRYFNGTPSVKVALITDGVHLKFFTDLKEPNIMDSTPWLEIDLLNLKPGDVEALRRFRKSDFVPEEIAGLAEETVYYNGILRSISDQMREPKESFVRWIAGELPDMPRVTGKLVERLTPIVRRAIHAAIVDHVARSFERAPEPVVEAPPPPVVVPAPAVAVVAAAEPKAGVVTTAEEIEAARIVSEWIRELRPTAAFAYRDGKTYFTLHQNNLRKWFARFALDRKPAWVALRHVKPDEGRVFAPGVEVMDGAGFGDSRFALTSMGELAKLRTAVIASYDREVARVGDEAGDGETARE